MTARGRRAGGSHHDIERRRIRQDPSDRRPGCGTMVCGRTPGVKLQVYKHLLAVNAGFDQVIRGLAALRKHESFHRRELDHYSSLSKEARAATNSYLTAVLERVETAEAGRRPTTGFPSRKKTGRCPTPAQRQSRARNHWRATPRLAVFRSSVPRPRRAPEARRLTAAPSLE